MNIDIGINNGTDENYKNNNMIPFIEKMVWEYSPSIIDGSLRWKLFKRPWGKPLAVFKVKK